MEVQLSIKAKLVVTPEAGRELKASMEEFNRACNTLSELAFQQDLSRKYDIHHAGYRLIRGETNLPSQHVINAIAKVSAGGAPYILMIDHSPSADVKSHTIHNCLAYRMIFRKSH